MVTDFIERVRAALKAPGVTPAGLARKAGLHRNTLYGAELETWNPTADVLKALEPHIEDIEREADTETNGDSPTRAAA